MFRQLETDKRPNHRSSFLLALHQDNSYPGYAPTNEADDEVKDDFYEQLQKIVDEVPRHDMLLVIGDWNAKVGEQQLGEEGIIGKFGMTGERSDNGERFVSFCTLNNLAIASTMFPHKQIHRYTWTSPNGHYHNQIDHVAIRSNFKRSVQDVRAFRGVCMYVCIRN